VPYINESFDIEDMGNNITASSHRKEKVGKHSKIYKRLMDIINSGFDFDNAFEGIDIDYDIFKFIEYLYDNPDMVDDDCMVLMNSHFDLDELYVKMVKQIMDLFIEELLGDSDYIQNYCEDFIERYVNGIKSKDAILYAYYQPGDYQ